jgi:hypothetical protein
MRKLFWCCSAAGVLVVGGMFSVSYYASQNPESAMGHCLATAANTSIVIQPVVGLGSVVARATHHVRKPHETENTTGSIEECVPAEPEPIEPEKTGVHVPPAIIIPEDDPPPREEDLVPPAVAEPPQLRDQDLADTACPVVMPYCIDDDDPMLRPTMPYADGEKNANALKDSTDDAMKAWKEFFKGESPVDDSGSSEESKAPPAEKPSTEPKCQEDSHMHEHYPGCPSTTCPFTGKSYPSGKSDKKFLEQYHKRVWDFEETSEEPPQTPKEHGKKAAPGKGCDGKNSCPRTQGVDTMEYRRSDGGLNEYGPGPF